MYDDAIDETHSDILIIDDAPANLQLLSSILKDRGHQVRAVVSGKMGLIAARTVVPHLILLDVKMPDLDGYEVCQELKNDARLRDIPVIFISSLEETLDKVKAFHVGGVDYITKPFQVEEVIARVETQLTLYKVYRQAQQSATRRERERLARDYPRCRQPDTVFGERRSRNPAVSASGQSGDHRAFAPAHLPAFSGRAGGNAPALLRTAIGDSGEDKTQHSAHPPC